MIKLKISNFKCFYDIEIPINELTIFAGANGNGKSTSIQALLLLRRTIEHCAKWEGNAYNLKEVNGLNVELNGAYCLNLGNSEYLLPIDYTKTEINLGLITKNEAFSINYSTNQGNDLWITPIEPLVNNLKENPLYFQEFYYLNAERLGPRIAQNIQFFDYENTGYKGEYTAQVISNLNYNFKIEEGKIFDEKLKGNKFFINHINAWLSYILNGTTITPHYDDKTHSARIEVQNSYSKGNPIVPTNTGFGISYVLPIIVSGLIAKKNRLLIVENPEAHLHPSAQSKMGEFLSIIANSGVKVIVETHSDHILNGIQLACAKNKIDNNKVTINYFDKVDDSIQPQINSISINQRGELSDWPKGFFDQSQKDFSELFKIRRNE